MKLSASNIAWLAEQDEAVYQRLKILGFTGIEIAPTRWVSEAPYSNEGVAMASAIARELKSNWNFSVSSMQSLWFGQSQQLFGTEQERSHLERYTEQALAFAKAIGCGHVVFGSPKNRIRQRDNDDETGRAFFSRLADVAQAHGVVIGMEANPAVYGTDYINATSEAAALVRAVDKPYFKLNLDLGTVLINNEGVDVVADVLPLVSHVHISEPELNPIAQRQLHSELAALLQTENYQGWVSLEMKNQGLDPLFASLDILEQMFS